jgi:hypothetical protein
VVLRPRYGALAATLAAAGLACAWFIAGYPTLIFDSLGYYILTGVLRAGGLARWPTDTWTYGYPLFEAVVTGWRDLPPEKFRLIVFLAQLVVWLAVSALVARRLAAIYRSPRVGAAAYALAALNPVPLLQTTESLSDLLSAALVLAAVALTWRTPDEGPDGPPLARPFFSFLAAAFAAMVRPANVVVIVAIGIVWILRGLAFRDFTRRHVAAAAAGLVPPFLPQLAINFLTFGTFNPLIGKNLYHLQAEWGMRALKYATLVIPGKSPLLVYANPLYRGDPTPGTFLVHHPAHYAATLLLHGFGLIDRDLPFTYATDLGAWYRLPLALANFLVLYLAAAGLAVGLARLVRRRRMDEPAFVTAGTALVAAAYFALYLPVEVECRFGVALQALATPLIVGGMAAVAGPGELRRRVRVAVLALAPVAIAAALALSAWVTRQRVNVPVGGSGTGAGVDAAPSSRRPASTATPNSKSKRTASQPDP